MKKLILSTLTVLALSAGINAQKSLFENISTTDQYIEYYSVRDDNNDGKYVIKDPRFVVKFQKEYLPTGEGYAIRALVDEGKNKDFLAWSMSAAEEGVVCTGHPYESMLTEDKESFVAIGDYVFVLYELEVDGAPFYTVSKAFIKKGAVAPAAEDGEKKKMTMKERMIALNELKNGGASYGPEHKALQSQNLDEMVADYLAVMKVKQDARTPEQLKSEENIKVAKVAKANAKDNEWAEAKRYNDSIKATAEYQDLQKRKEQNERNYQASKTKNTVTLRNNSSSAIYVGTSGSSNRGTKIDAGGTASWSCIQDAYIQTSTQSGGSTVYSSSSNKVYSADSNCGSTVVVR
jgi:hypothetical protein